MELNLNLFRQPKRNRCYKIVEEIIDALPANTINELTGMSQMKLLRCFVNNSKLATHKK